MRVIKNNFNFSVSCEAVKTDTPYFEVQKLQVLHRDGNSMASSQSSSMQNVQFSSADSGDEEIDRFKICLSSVIKI